MVNTDLRKSLRSLSYFLEQDLKVSHLVEFGIQSRFQACIRFHCLAQLPNLEMVLDFGTFEQNRLQLQNMFSIQVRIWIGIKLVSKSETDFGPRSGSQARISIKMDQELKREIRQQVQARF